ncbi:MAG: hypothetical protein M0042_16815 [Nitrospiraceae bacterium]|nr:hypothetical protein [Nitrospiraceae bacterium]
MPALVLLGALVCAVVVWLAVDWKLDEHYVLQPGSWQGEMAFQGRNYPFEMVIERAADGKMTGYMDWVSENPRYRLAIRGTYVGNHVRFEDYAFLERQGQTGLYDQQDVYIIGNEMTGTAKNGAASIHALQRAYAPK